MFVFAGCAKPRPPLREPDSVESLCRERTAIAPKAFKLPSIEGLRNDRLVKGQLLHVDIEAVRRTVAATGRVIKTGQLSDDMVRKALIEAGGGVIVHWDPPVTVHLTGIDAKSKPQALAVFAAAASDATEAHERRELYLLESDPGERTPHWLLLIASDEERICA